MKKEVLKLEVKRTGEKTIFGSYYYTCDKFVGEKANLEYWKEQAEILGMELVEGEIK